MYDPCVLFRGPVALSAFVPAVTGEAWRPGPDYDALVAPAWRQRVDDVAARGHRLWDGTHYRLTHAEDIGRTGTLRLGTVAFRYIATFRILHAQHGAHGLPPLHHLSTAALLRTSDGFYVFGKRAINGTIDLIGGGLQADDGAPDFEGNIRKEIREETGIDSGALGVIEGLGVVRSTTSNVLVVAHLETTLTADGVQAAFARREDDEMAEPVFVPRDRIAAYLRAMTDYRPLLADLL